MTSYEDTPTDATITTLTLVRTGREDDSVTEQIFVSKITSNGTSEISERYAVNGAVCNDGIAHTGPEWETSAWWWRRLDELERDGYRQQH
jgi:hypothetical protein